MSVAGTGLGIKIQQQREPPSPAVPGGVCGLLGARLGGLRGAHLENSKGLSSWPWKAVGTLAVVGK